MSEFFLKAETHQADLKELAAMKADRVIVMHQHLDQKAALEHTSPTAN